MPVSDKRAEREIEKFITKRHDQRVAAEGERPAQAWYVRGTRKREADRREANRVAWAEHHGRLADYLFRAANWHLKERRRYEHMIVGGYSPNGHDDGSGGLG
jgi:hypothetical protein